MISKESLVISIIIGIMIINAAEGLQCYVCEDCNEYQDFKELHICGEISSSATQKPSTLPEILGSTSTSVSASTSASSSKPSVSDETEEYVYEDSVEAHDDSGVSSEKGANKTVGTTATITNPTTGQVSQGKNDTTVGPSSVIATSSTTAQPPKDYDYMEYEDRKSDNFNRRSNGSLLKIDEPVCYMYRYYANNTVITNRGCTTLLNASKFLTCEALSNATPTVACRVCSVDGCNKFDLDETGEDHLNGGILKEGSALMIAILGIVLISVV